MTAGLIAFVVVVATNIVALLLDLLLHLSGWPTITTYVQTWPMLGVVILLWEVAGVVGLALHFCTCEGG